jgi:hypothetical protein|tara:strand:- start:40 stop:756 length:717 start_codon:yes stop_codon:yes gene_type:complete
MKDTLKTKPQNNTIKKIRGLKYCKWAFMNVYNLANEDPNHITSDDIHAVTRIWYDMVRQAGEVFSGLTTDPHYNKSKKYTADHYWKPQRAAEWVLECTAVGDDYISQQQDDLEGQVKSEPFELTEETHKHMIDLFQIFFDMRKVIKTTPEINTQLRQQTKTVLTKDSYKSLGIKLYDIHGNEVNNELPIPEVYTNWEKHYLQTTRTQQITRLDDILKDTVIGQLAKKELKTYRGMLDV